MFLGEIGVVNSSSIRTFSSEGRATSSSYVREEQNNTIVAREACNITKGNIVGGSLEHFCLLQGNGRTLFCSRLLLRAKRGYARNNIARGS
jgi:hypothetical protein